MKPLRQKRKDSNDYKECCKIPKRIFDDNNKKSIDFNQSMLSKSKFILGQQCNKSFWFDINNIEPTNPLMKGL